MSNKNYITKNSQYVESLVNFIKDTKPYHSKLTEISEEYQFFDVMDVKFLGSLNSKHKLSGVWPFTYFSSGDVNGRFFKGQRLTTPLFSSHNNNYDLKNTGQYKTYKDEVGEFGVTPDKIGLPVLPNNPSGAMITRDQTIFAYDKKYFDGIGVNDAFVQREGKPNLSEPLLEGHDFFQSHGAFKFQIVQTYNASNKFSPVFTSTNDARLIFEATQSVREAGLNPNNPNSSINVVREIINDIRAAVGIVGREDLREEIENITRILDVPNLPTSYSKMFKFLRLYGVYDANNVEALRQQLNRAASPLFFGKYTDLGYRESGELHYSETDDEFIRIFDIEIDEDNEKYEEWTLTSMLLNEEVYRIEGSLSGIVGYLQAGESFANLKIAFKTESKGIPYVGYKASIKPSNKIIIHKNAKRESWTLIKVNPLAYSRPFFMSKRYGNITNLDGVMGQISILDQTFSSTQFYLKAVNNGTQFEMTSPNDESFYEFITVNVPFNNGILAFTINSGSEFPFFNDDAFYIDIKNEPARVEDIDFGYGYDLDSFDDQDIMYDDNSQPLNFGYATRFPDFNLDNLNIKVTEKAIHKRKWRARALPSTQFITDVDTFQLPNSIRPDKLKFYYADRFAVEWSDDDFKTVNYAQDILPEQQFSTLNGAVVFSIPYADKPYIAARSDDSPGDPEGLDVIGGDIISFTVINPPPYIENSGLVSSKVPRLIMHGDSYYESPASKWSVSMTNESSYIVKGNKKTQLSLEKGMSFNDLGVHFTIIGGARGLKSGDVFTFETYKRKPSYLVHGSVSGWKGEAEIGRYFTNGDISFKIDLPKAEIFTTNIDANNIKTTLRASYRPLNTWSFGAGEIQISRIRPDSISSNYYFKRSANGYLVSNPELGVVGFSPFTGNFESKMLSFRIQDPKLNEFTMRITAHNFVLWTGHNAVIVRPKEEPRWPKIDDFILLEKTKSSNLSISLTHSNNDITPLLPESIDRRFIDLDTNSDTPLINSIETDVFTGWIPVTRENFDIGSSKAAFSDTEVTNIFTSAASGEIVGKMFPTSNNLNENVLFEWDKRFLTKYLPLNTETNLIVSNPAWNDTIKLNFSETLRWLYGSGLIEDQDMDELLLVKMIPDALFKIKIGDETNGSSPIKDKIHVRIDDGRFNGFVPGYDNMPFDAEALSQMSSNIDLMTNEDVQAVLDKMELDLSDPNLSALEKRQIRKLANIERDAIMTEAAAIVLELYQQDNIGNYDADEPAPTYNGFGIPTVGLGIDVNENPKNFAGASIQEIMTFNALNYGNGLDMKSFGNGPIDEEPDSIFVVNISGNSPVDYIGKSFNEFDTQLETINARTFEINLSETRVPEILLWYSDDLTPTSITELTQIAPQRFKFSIPTSAHVKLIVI